MSAQPTRVARDAGSGSALAVALVAAVLLVAVTSLPLYMGLARTRELAAAADAAALAAADTASGALAGVPCEAAASVAEVNGARLERCEIDRAIATVVVQRTVLGTTIEARARAGPPEATGERHGVGGRGDD